MLHRVRARNDDALATIGNPESTAEYKRIKEILDSDAKIPYIGRENS